MSNRILLLQSLLLLLLLLLLSTGPTLSYVVPSVVNRNSNARSPTALNVVGPKQLLAMEKMKNPEKYESTVRGMMQKLKLTREQAEARYGEFLVDPDGFALRAGEAQRREKGYKNWEEQAIAESDDPESTRQRIQDFKEASRNKALGLIAVLLGGVFYLSSNKLQPTLSGVQKVERTNPYYQQRLRREAEWQAEMQKKMKQ